MKNDLSELGLIDAHYALVEKSFSKENYVTSLIERIDKVEPVIGVFAHYDSAQLRQAYAKLDYQDVQTLPLWGVPVGVKDIIDTERLNTERGSEAFKGRVAKSSASVVERIQNLGGVILGKTVTTEFAWRFPGKTKNPWNNTYTPGGSSSGSAAGVAAKLMPAALGTQTLGSVIRPAAYCGVVGFKPSFGAISRTGVYPLALSLDHVGVFTRSVADAAYLASSLFHNDGLDLPHLNTKPISSSPDWRNWAKESSKLSKPLKIGFLRTSKWNLVSTEQQLLMDKVAELLNDSGAHVREVELPEPFDSIWATAELIQYAEAGQINESLAKENPSKISAVTQALVLKGLNITMVDYVKARRIQQELIAEFSIFMKGFDALLTMPATGEAPHGLNDTGNAVFCTPFTLLGSPAITLPAGWSSNGLPLGIQLVSDWGRDDELLKIAAYVETQLASIYSHRKIQLSNQVNI